MQRKSDNAKNIGFNRMAAAVASECITQQIPPIGTTIQDKLEAHCNFHHGPIHCMFHTALSMLEEHLFVSIVVV